MAGNMASPYTVEIALRYDKTVRLPYDYMGLQETRQGELETRL